MFTNLLYLVACPLVSEADLKARWDVDGDGASRPQDCDDLDPTVGAAAVWYADLDGDGYGSAASSPVCQSPAGYVEAGGDCDDDDPFVNPNVVWFADADGDGWGGTATTRSCAQPRGYSGSAGDCDDDDANANPAAAEVCDGRDEDCSGVADDPGVAEVCSDRLDNDCDGVVASCAVSGQTALSEAPTRILGDIDAPIDVVGHVGDIDGDGRAELVVGAPRAVADDWDTSGLFAVFPSSLEGEAGILSAPVLVRGTDFSEHLGTSFAGADLDGDGHRELAVGAPGSALVHLWFSPVSGGTSGSADISVYWDKGDFGRSVANAGDFNGDGREDLVASATYAAGTGGSTNCCGHVGIIRGGEPGQLWVDPEILGDETDAHFGLGLAGGGDFDGDGLDDIAAGAPGHAYGQGAVYLFRGGFTGTLSPSAADSMILGNGGSTFGEDIAILPDANGDGVPELLVGDGSGARALMYGQPLDNSTAASVFMDSGYGFGSDADHAGDVDGDGLPDVVITNPYAVGGDGKYDGAAYVFFSPIPAGTLMADDAGGTLRGSNGGGMAGTSGGTVGDLDADGFDDFFVLDQDYVNGSADPGTAWILYGGAG